jgi:pantetheine-phosphate adenylyltransferase
MHYRHVAVGGTFDHFHIGHEQLIKKAFETGGFITIGITSNIFAGKDLDPFEARKSEVEIFLDKIGCKTYSIVELEDPFGPAVSDESIDAIVISEETFTRAVELNKIRDGSGLEELAIIKIPMLLAADGKVLSSSRIRKGEIDRWGSVL